MTASGLSEDGVLEPVNGAGGAAAAVHLPAYGRYALRMMAASSPGPTLEGVNRAAAVLLRHRPVLLDWAIVVVLCVGTVVGWVLDRADQPGWALPLDLAACLALGWRRSRPLPVLAVVVAVDVVQIVADVPANTLIYATLIAIYSVAAYA